MIYKTEMGIILESRAKKFKGSIYTDLSASKSRRIKVLYSAAASLLRNYITWLCPISLQH